MKKVVSKEPNKMVYFFDESRFGTHSKIGHGWFPKGSRTSVKINLGFKSFYVYGAVCTKSGNSFSLVLPEVNTENMNIFLKKFSEQIGLDQVIFIMDGASWHKSKNLVIPKNIKAFYLPPYSPDLNPIERLWSFIKKYTLRNKCYINIEDLEKDVCEFINKLESSSIKKTCTAKYLFN